MPALEGVTPAALRELLGDPLRAYTLAAAALLGGVAVGTGLLRGELRLLGRAHVWVVAALAALAALGLAVAGDAVAAALPGETWPLEGVRRLPLYVVALGYGPLLGVVAAALFLPVEAVRAPIAAGEAILLLEAAVVGWLALAPSPRQHRLVAPIAVVLGWGLAWLTAGSALLAAAPAPFDVAALGAALAATAPGVGTSALLLGLPSAATWRRAFPDARGDDGARRIPPLVRPPPRRALPDEPPPSPPPPFERRAGRERRRRERRLVPWTPPPDDEPPPPTD